MNLSRKWLNDYVKTEHINNKDFVAALTMSGSKVETYHSLSEPLKNVVLGKVLQIDKHKDSDKLWICQLDIGKAEPIQIVTAAQNLFVGALVPAVLDGGVVIDHKTKAPVEIKSGELRGVMSSGMMCSFQELGMEKNDFPYAADDGILIFNTDSEVCAFPVGTDIAKAVGIDDTTVEFEITNNRPDCLSVLGLAREASVTFNLPFTVQEPIVKATDGDIHDRISVRVENKDKCLRYMAGMVENVIIRPSPRWLAERLRASGVRAINNLVDITNFVMLEYGHPMHAFDAKYIKDNTIVVRSAKEGETITLLDKSVIPLDKDMLVIADSTDPVAIAGVMGGEFSGIMADTKTVIFEAACFDGVSVRKTAQRIAHRTESSSRFEKGLDPANAKNALYRALELIEELECGTVVGGIIDISCKEKPPSVLKHDYKWINKSLGADISEEEQIQIFLKLGFSYDRLTHMVTAPPTRIDILLPCDLAEEVARIYGYNNIESTLPKLLSKGVYTDVQKFRQRLVDAVLSQGCNEVMTFSFISPRYYEKAQIAKDKRKSVTLLNPLGEDTSVMRTTALPSMLEVISKNYNNRTLAGRFFELARVYLPVDGEVLPNERDILQLGIYGENEDFYTLKGIVESILLKISANATFKPLVTDKSYHEGRAGNIELGGKVVGTLGEVHPAVVTNYGVSGRIYAASLDIGMLFEATNLAINSRKYKKLPRFPAITRDLSLVCRTEVTSDEVIEVIKQNATDLEDVKFFDMYEGLQVATGFKSLSYKLIFRKDGTLTDKEIDETIANILLALKNSKGMELRK